MLVYPDIFLIHPFPRSLDCLKGVGGGGGRRRIRLSKDEEDPSTFPQEHEITYPIIPRGKERGSEVEGEKGKDAFNDGKSSNLSCLF